MATVSALEPEALLTAEEFEKRPDSGFPEELVRGRIVPLSQPTRRHGQICARATRILGDYAEEHDLGHVVSNDSAIITRRNPDTVRGPDVAFYSYDRLPRGPLPASYGPEMPELVVEVRSPNDRWVEVLAKVSEYLTAGVLFVLVLDGDRQMAHLFGAEDVIRMLGPDDEFSVPEVLGDFRVLIRRFFE
jgi:Uma2 family endonuclease